MSLYLMAHFFRVSVVRILMACAIYVRFFSAGCIFMNKRDTFFRQLFTYIQVTKGEKRMHLMRRGRCTGLTNKWARSKGFVVDDRLNIDNNIRHSNNCRHCFVVYVWHSWCTNSLFARIRNFFVLHTFFALVSHIFPILTIY